MVDATHNGIPLTDGARELLYMFACPHINREPLKPVEKYSGVWWERSNSMRELREKAMIREGVALTLPKVNVVAAESFTQEEFVASVKRNSEPRPGTVATRRGMEWIAAHYFGGDPRIVSEMRVFVLDEDP